MTGFFTLAAVQAGTVLALVCAFGTLILTGVVVLIWRVAVITTEVSNLREDVAEIRTSQTSDRAIWSAPSRRRATGHD